MIKQPVQVEVSSEVSGF